MATVSTLLSDLGSRLNDPNAEVFTSTIKLVALNNAQHELVLRVLAFNPTKFEGIYDLLSEIIEEEENSVAVTGFDFASLSNRNILRNGFVNSRIVIDGEYKFPVRYSIDRFGMTENRFLSGSNDYPVCRIVSDKYYLDIDVGSYPIDVTMWYVGQPYTLAAAVSGSGKTQSVATPDLNVIMHDVLVKIAHRDLLRHRGDQTDFAQAREVEQQVTLEIQSLVRGQQLTPKSGTVGQYSRKQEREEVA